jgi:hypothetical protein
MLAKHKLVLHNISNPNPKPTTMPYEPPKNKFHEPLPEDYSSPARALSLAIIVTIVFVTAACAIALSL